MWVATHKIARSPGHPFYVALNGLLGRAGFDRFVEELCEPYYADGVGRPSIPPGIYFRMLMVGYFEGIDSQRGIAWRCSDSFSLREFLGLALDEPTPDHSSLTRIRQRLPLQVHLEAFRFVLRLMRQEGLLSGSTLGVDATTLEANAAMKSIVRKDSGEDWGEYVKGLMAEEGLPAGREEDDGEPTDQDARTFDRRRGGKKVSNKEWESPTDPEARITRMKDGRTHLAYKAVHAVDLESEAVVAVAVEPADRGDAEMLIGHMERAEDNLFEAEAEPEVKEVVADKGYHKAEALAACAARQTRTYIPERKVGRRRRWAGKPAGWQEAFYGNRRRVRGDHGRELQRRRSEVMERSFAHVCKSGGARRTWLRGLVRINKRYLIQVAAHNLSLVMRKVFGHGKPRALQGLSGALSHVLCLARWLLDTILGPAVLTRPNCPALVRVGVAQLVRAHRLAIAPQEAPSSTGC
jgi:IS5 family transposase